MLENSLRPPKLVDYIGQDKVKSNLSIFIAAAASDASRSIMFSFTGRRGWVRRRSPISSPGNWMWTSRSRRVLSSNAPAIWRRFSQNMHEHEVLFIDEIHRLSHVVEEILYPAMEDFHIDILIGQGRRPAR
jgi:Holliday junction DNA helicase RuvB